MDNVNIRRLKLVVMTRAGLRPAVEASVKIRSAGEVTSYDEAVWHGPTTVQVVSGYSG